MKLLLQSVVFVFVFAFPLLVAAQAPPQVVSLSPAHRAAEVAAGQTTTLTIRFDQAMGGGRSICGGGPSFPKLTGAPVWKDPKTLVMEVELEPDRTYAMSLNSFSFTNFRSTEGVALVPVPWTFTTLPAELPEPAVQKQRNKKAIDALSKALAGKYSYYDLRVKDWKKVFAAARPALLAAKTDSSWASAAARMLEPAGDIHMYLRCGERVFATGTRAIDPLFRSERLETYVGATRPIGDEKGQKGRAQALWARTDDGIGYLLIASWTPALDLDAVDRALTGLRDCKALIVDVRPNSGGDETMAQRVAAWFVDGTRVYARNRYRVRAGEKGFGPVYDRAVTGNTDPERRFQGPIALLTSRYVMSSNEAFVMMLKQAKDCTVVGQTTFGSSANPKPHELGNGVTIVIPSWQSLRLDGSCFEGVGIPPDVHVDVTPEELGTKDPILSRALELLRGKIGASAR